jgi:hypothetical protein
MEIKENCNKALTVNLTFTSQKNISILNSERGKEEIYSV